MRTYRTFTDIEESYFREHPEEIDAYLTLTFEEYAIDGNTGALLSSLHVLSRVKDVAKTGEKGASQQDLQKVLAEDPNPAFASINTIMHAMGYRLTPQRLYTNP